MGGGNGGVGVVGILKARPPTCLREERMEDCFLTWTPTHPHASFQYSHA